MARELSGFNGANYVFGMDDGMIPISELKVGTVVKGVFGKNNTIIDIKDYTVYSTFLINNTIQCSSAVCFLTTEGVIVTPSPAYLYRCVPECQTCSQYLSISATQKMEINMTACFLNNGSRVINSIDETQGEIKVYSFDVDGDHTCFVNGYAVFVNGCKPFIGE
jgi:hypothetical protein